VEYCCCFDGLRQILINSAMIECTPQGSLYLFQGIGITYPHKHNSLRPFYLKRASPQPEIGFLRMAKGHIVHVMGFIRRVVACINLQSLGDVLALTASFPTSLQPDKDCIFVPRKRLLFFFLEL